MGKKLLLFLVVLFIKFNLLNLLSAAAKPENVLIVINDASPESREIGLYYQKARNIPDVNVLHYTGITMENIGGSHSPEEYNKLVTAIKSHINSRDLYDKIDYIVLTKGTPLRVNLPGAYYSVTNCLVTMDALPDTIRSTFTAANPYSGINFNGTKHYGQEQINESFSHSKTYNGYTHLYLVTRLDGYTVEQVKGLIDNSIKASSLTTAVKYLFDAKPSGGGYKIGDDNILAASNVLKANGFNNVIYEGTNTIATGYTDLGGYFSWGSNAGGDFTLAKFQSLLFAPGSIGETYVSSGGRTFKYPKTWPDYSVGDYDNPDPTEPQSPGNSGQSLIADLVKQGITGVSGYVSEPGLSGCENVETLVTRYYVEEYNLAESFYMASPSVNWMMVLIGDPLCPLPPASQSLSEIMSSTPVNIYPQPFKVSLGHTTIYFTKLTTHTRLQIFNVAGELVYDEEKDTPNEQMEWNTLNSRGEAVSSGIYFYVVTDENNNIRKGKLAILR